MCWGLFFGNGGAGAEPVVADRKQYGYCHYQCCHASCARRDIHNSGQGYAEWDYSSGAARMLEAIMTALAVAAGVGASMALFHQLTGEGPYGGEMMMCAQMGMQAMGSTGCGGQALGAQVMGMQGTG